MDEKKDGHMQITTFFDISRLRRLQNLIKKWFWCEGIEKRKEINENLWPVVVQKAIFLELMNHLSYIVIDGKDKPVHSEYEVGKPK